MVQKGPGTKRVGYLGDPDPPPHRRASAVSAAALVTVGRDVKSEGQLVSSCGHFFYQ